MYLKLQPCRELAVATRKTLKLPARFYGPSEVSSERIGNGAYELKLPLASKIHPISHVSMLKGKVGKDIQVLQI